MESKKAEEIKKKAEADASKMLKGAEQKGRQIIEEARKTANAEAIKILKEIEQKGRQIIEEAKKKAEGEAKTAKPAPESEQKGRLIIEEARKTANAEAIKILKEVEQKGRLIIDEAVKKAESQIKADKPAPDHDQRNPQILEEARVKAEAEAGKIITQAEQKARQIIEEAERIAAAPAAQRPQQIMKAVKEKAYLDTKGKSQQPKAAYKKRVEIVVIPPVDFAQLERLRKSLQHLPDLRVLAIGGSPGGGTQISILMDKPAPIVESLRGIDVVEEAIEEDLLDSHPLGDFLKQATPGHPTKRPSDEQRILVVLKRSQ
ncbi:MAG: hypothetical protein NTV59_00385 [Chloroflexi bacterium]|nr:hypothetical protein [Chloroflexota bacterium]